jgi:hypothetical protein
MTQSDNPNRDPRRIHNEEQFYADATVHLNRVLAMLDREMPDIFAEIGNSDPSVTFSWLRNYIVEAEKEFGMAAHLTTVLMCAAAITRLVGAPPTDDVLAQLDWKPGEPK